MPRKKKNKETKEQVKDEKLDSTVNVGEEEKEQVKDEKLDSTVNAGEEEKEQVKDEKLDSTVNAGESYEDEDDFASYSDSDLYVWNSKLEYYKRKIEATNQLTEQDKEEIQNILQKVSEYTTQKSLMLYKQGEQKLIKIDELKSGKRKQELSLMMKEANAKTKIVLNTMTSAVATSTLEPSTLIRQITNVQGSIVGIMMGLAKIGGNIAKIGGNELKAKVEITKIKKDIDDAIRSLNEGEEKIINKGKKIIDLGAETTVDDDDDDIEKSRQTMGIDV